MSCPLLVLGQSSTLVTLCILLLLFICRTCLELLQALFRLSEVGHYDAVVSLFAVPSKNCADVLLLSMLQARVSGRKLFVSTSRGRRGLDPAGCSIAFFIPSV